MMAVIVAEKPQLLELWLYQTGIGDEGATKIAEALPSLGQLQWLELGQTAHGFTSSAAGTAAANADDRWHV